MESQDQQDPGQEPAQSQETPSQDSGLQTPQPDQPVPTKTDGERISQPENLSSVAPSGEPAAADAGPSGQAAEGTVDPLADPELSEASRRNVEQERAEVQKEQELEADRRARQERLGNEGQINEGEVQEQRQIHNERTGGGDVPQA